MGFVRRSKRWLGVLGAVLFLYSGALSAQTDDVVDLLVQQRLRARSAEILAEVGREAEPRPLERIQGFRNLYLLWMERNLAHLQLQADSIRALEEAALAQAQQDEEQNVGLTTVEWRKYPAEEQGEFLALYYEAFWRAAWAPHPLDTLHTPAMRGRLNGVFGAPTRNAAAREQEGYAGSEYVQFEYWLEVNEEIPVLVMDAEGPFGRGVLLAIDESYLEYFDDIKLDLFNRLDNAEPVPYADYYHSRDENQWYRTGYDGEAYFTNETRRPRWASRQPRDEKWRIFR